MNNETLADRLEHLAYFLNKEANALRVQAPEDGYGRGHDMGTAQGFDLAAKWIREELAAQAVTK